MDMDDSEDFSILPGFEGLEELYAIEDVCNESSMLQLHESDFKTGGMASADSGTLWADNTQPKETGQSRTEMQGIQAFTMESLLDQFEDTTTSSSDGRDDIQFHNVTDDAPFQSQSLPASRVCSAANSPAPTPPTTPPPDILHKIRSNHSQASKRKATIMLPYAAPTKRGKGRAAVLERPQAASRTSRLQKILSRNSSTPSLSSELPESFQPDLSAEFQPIQVAGVNSVGVSSVQHNNSGVSNSVVCPTASLGAPAELRMSRVTDPGMAQSILSKTPRALSLLAGSTTSANLATVSESKATTVSKSAGVNPNAALQVLNVRSSSSGFVSLLPKSATEVNGSASSGRMNQSRTVSKGVSIQPLKASVVEEEPQRRCNIVLSRGAEHIPAEGLQSVLDHDYCHDSLRRVIVDEFDLVVSPTKSHCQKPIQKVKSLPILPSDHPGQTQLVGKKNTTGQSHGVGLRGPTANTHGQPVRLCSVTQAIPQVATNLSAANSNTVINLIMPSVPASSAATCVPSGGGVQNTKDKQAPGASNPPQPVTVSLMSVLSKVQNIESLFTLENGTLKLHPSVTASMNPAALVAPATPVPQNQQHIRPSAGSAVSTAINSAGQKNSIIQGTSAVQVVPPASQNAQQNENGATSTTSSTTWTVENIAGKKPQQTATRVIPLTTCIPGQSTAQVSNTSTVASGVVQTNKVLAKVPNVTLPDTASGAKTDINRNTLGQPSELPLFGGSNISKAGVTCNATSVQEQKIPPPQTLGRSSKDQFSHSTEIEKSTTVTEVPNSCRLGEESDSVQVKEGSETLINSNASDQPGELKNSQSDTTSNAQDSPVLYSMPVFDFDEPSSSDMSDRVVTPVKNHPHTEPSPAGHKSPSLSPAPHSPQTSGEKTSSPAPSPKPVPVVSPKNDPQACSPRPSSPEAGTSHEPAHQYIDEFDLVWEEHEQQAAAQVRANQDRKTVTYEDKTSSASQEAGPSVGRGTSRRGRKSARYGGGKEWKPGSSTVKEDSSGYFSKIPSYYTALSIPTKTGRKQLTAEDADGLTIRDFIPADRSPVRHTEEVEWYDKMPSYFSCFTNSTKYDSALTHGDSNSAGKGDQTKNTVSCSSAGGSPKSLSPGCSQQKLPSPARSRHSSRSRSRDGERSRKRRRSNSSSGSSRSGSGRRSWRRSKRRQRRSPSVSGSCRSSSGSRSRSRSSSRSRSRSGSRYSRSYSRSKSRSRSRSRSRGRRYRSRSRERRYSPDSRRSRRHSASRDSSLRKQMRREEKIKKMEERKIVYVGRIPEGYTRRKLHQRFERFGKIEDVSVHFREAGDNYGFVTFYDAADAFRAIDKGNSIPNERQFDLCFGGRRHFCANEYADLDGNRVIEEEYAPVTSKDTMDFDELLRQAQRSLRK